MQTLEFIKNCSLPSKIESLNKATAAAQQNADYSLMVFDLFSCIEVS